MASLAGVIHRSLMPEIGSKMVIGSRPPAKRIAPGPPGVFGLDELDLTLAGYSNGGVSASCTGFAKQSPGLKLAVTLVRMGPEASIDRPG